MRARHLLPLLSLLIFITANSATHSSKDRPATKPIQKARIAEQYGRLPLAFEWNQGQTDARARYFARSGGYAIWLTDDGAVLGRAGHEPVRLNMQGARKPRQIEAVEKLPGVANYLIGADRSQWRTHVPLYGRVMYREVYRGVDVAFYGKNGRFEYDLEVAPGADPSQITIVHEGARGSRLNAAGDLVLATSFGDVTMKRPVAYQHISGKRREVAVRYEVKGEQVRFALARYDRREKLTIDPVVVYSFAITGSDAGPAGIAVDNVGSAYVAGSTVSAQFPVVTPGLQTAPGGGGDAFVAKLNANGTALVYATYIGGSGLDQAAAIAVDSAGSAYLAGNTSSTNFPMQAAVQSVAGAQGDAWAAKLNPAGTSLVYSTYLGGGGQDAAKAIAIDGGGQAYITGTTQSANFPTANPFQAAFGGQTDMFLTRLNAAGAFSYSTYIGGALRETARAIAVDTNGAAYITGDAAANSLPLVNPILATATASGEGAFVTMMVPNGTSLQYSTFVGTNYLRGTGVAVDINGSAYLTGTTNISGNPTSYLIKMSPGGFGLTYNNIINGSLRGVGIDSTGAAYVSNCTNVSGSATTLATAIEKWNPSGSARMYVQTFPTGTCGTEPDATGNPIAIDSVGAAYLFTGAGFANKVTPVITNPVQVITQVTPVGCGSINASPGPMDNSDNYYQNGTSVLMTAVGNNCFFSQWSGDLVGTANPQFLNTFGNRTVTAIFTQCAVSLNPSGTVNVLSTTSSLTVSVNGTTNCPWNTTTNVSWLTITNFGNGIGSGSITLSVAPNTETSPRTGQVTIGGQTLNITQAGAPVCNYGLSTLTYSVSSAGGTGQIEVGSLPGCPWTATTSTPWISITSGATGTAFGTVRFSIAANTGYLRTGVLTIAGINVPVTQGPSPDAKGLAFVATTPCRLMETRAEYNFEGRTGAFGPPFLNAGETRTLTLANSICNIPPNARAYVLNVTLIPKTTTDFVTVYPGGEARPNYYTVSSPDGQIVANSAIVKSGSGTIAVYASHAADVLIDISGVFTDPSSGPNVTYYPLTPCRVIDTRIDYRSPAGPFGPPTMTARETRRFQFPATPYCSIPTGATAYSVTVTAVPPQPLAYLTAWPAGATQPNVSTINSFAGRVLANSVIIPASSNGSIDVFAFDSTDFIVDINGYFAQDNGSGNYFFPLPQCRAVNTTDATLPNPFGPPIFNDDTTRTVPLLSSSRCTGIPLTAKAFAINVTAFPGGSPMPFITVYPTGQSQPNASILNAFQGQIVSNAAIVPAGNNGSLNIYTYRRTNVVLELSGYFGR
ncbi:MAG: SBBP repeat-containing protein [Acidobacteria bacterium]|nr:SBBP repeat-containing protein [Acidobacteriota bacterium]